MVVNFCETVHAILSMALLSYWLSIRLTGGGSTTGGGIERSHRTHTKGGDLATGGGIERSPRSRSTGGGLATGQLHNSSNGNDSGSNSGIKHYCSRANCNNDSNSNDSNNSNNEQSTERSRFLLQAQDGKHLLVIQFVRLYESVSCPEGAFNHC